MYQFNSKGIFLSYVPVHTLAFSFSPENELIETNPYHGVRIYKDFENLEYTYFNENAPNTPRDIVNTIKIKDATYFLSVFKGLFAYDGNSQDERAGFTSFIESDIWGEKKLKHGTIHKNGLAISNEAGDIFIITLNDGFKISEKIPRAAIHGNTVSFLNSYKDWLIIATEKGLTFYNDEQQLFYDNEQGLKGLVTASSIKNNSLFMTTKNGIYTINLTKALHPSHQVSEINLTKLLVNKTPLRETAADNKYNLSVSENFIDISFETNTHPFPQKLHYSYRVKEQDAWQSITTNRITLDYMEPGSYHIEARVFDASTGKSTEASLASFTISPPFYKQWWFISAVSLLIILSVFWFFEAKRRSQLAHTAKEIAANKRLEELKTEALLAQMNPHFIFNALNSIQHLVVLGKNKKAAKYLSKFSCLVRTNLNNAQQPMVTLHEELDYLKTYCEIENERHGNRIAITFNIEKYINTNDVEIPTLILQPFLENAFVHAFPQKITAPELQLNTEQETDDIIKYTIKDNGIGNQSFSKPSHKLSKGTALIKERLHYLNYDVATSLNIEYNDDGTTVTLFL